MADRGEGFNQAQLTAKEMGRAFAEAMGTPRPERQLENFEKYEEHGEEFHIKAGTELPFMVLYTDEEYEVERKKWEYRSILSTARARKTEGGSVDSVTNPSPEERGLDPLGVEFKKERLDYLWREMPGLLAAKCVYTEIVGGPEFVGHMPNERKSKPEVKLLSVREQLLSVEITKGARLQRILFDKNDKHEGTPKLVLKRIMEWKEYEKDISKLQIRERNGENFLTKQQILKDKKGDRVEDDWISKNTLDVDKLSEVYSKDEIAKLIHEQSILGDGKRDKTGLLIEPKCPDSLYDANEPGFSVIRSSIRFFLKTKAVDLLFSDVEDREKILNPDLSLLEERIGPERLEQNREQIISEIKMTEINKRAREAEQAAWNFIFTTGLIESNNTPENNQYIRDLKNSPRPLGPSNFMTLYLWMAMHPQIRFQAKVFRSKDGLDDAKENWSSLGSWAANNLQKGTWRKPVLDDSKKPIMVPVFDENTRLPKFNDKGRVELKPVYKTEIPRFIRDDLVYDALREESNVREAVFDFFVNKGYQLLQNPSEIKSHKELYSEMASQNKWKDLPDSPFVNYRFDRLRWTNTIYTMFKKGPEATGKLPIADLAEGARMMGLTQTEVMNLLIMLEGINTNNPAISPAEGKIDWAFDVNSMKRAQPDLFRDYSKGREYL